VIHIESASCSALAAVGAEYDAARVLQRARGESIWPSFSDESILSQMATGCLFCVLEDQDLLGVFTIAHEDSAIWGDRESGEHLYLHRVARAMKVPGCNLIAIVLEWAHAECRRLGRAGLRLDTWAENHALVAFYERHGFRLVERRRMGTDPRLPPHYHGQEFALMEDHGEWMTLAGQ
jgi:GNAT superfamily N-acetyltransferase